MPTWAVVSVHNHHARGGFVEDHVSKRHANCAAANDEIVCGGCGLSFQA
jgi:hypothetical protein